METNVKKVDDDGLIGVRDYIIKKAIKKKEILHIKLEGTELVMTMSPHSLVDKLVRKKGPYTSQYDKNEEYFVNYYSWKPNLVPND